MAFVVVVIGMSLGGTTGYAINPARDFGPRLFYAIMPIKGKGSSKWSYAWIPVVGPMCGSVIATAFYLLLKAEGVFRVMCEITFIPLLAYDVLRLFISFILFLCCVILSYIFARKKPWDRYCFLDLFFNIFIYLRWL